MTKPRILIVNMMVPAGDGDAPQYTGEWRDGYELAIALAWAGADVTLLSPSIGKHETAVRNEIDPLALAAGVRLRYAKFVLNRRIASYLTVRLSFAWLREYLRLRPNLIIFKQARPDLALLIPGLKSKSLFLTTDDINNHTSIAKPPNENSNLIYRIPTRVETILNWISHRLVWSLAKVRPLQQQYHWAGLITASAPPQKPTDDATHIPTNGNTLAMRKGFLTYPDTIWQAQTHFDDVDVVFCGIIGLRKGVFELLKAWQHVKAGTTLAIVGIGPDEMQQRVDAAVRTLSGVTQWGSLGYFEKFALFRQAKVFVLPSKNDYYPSVIFEAMAAGLPVVTTRQILSPIEHGKNGLLVDADDINGLAEAINHLLTHEDERQRMAACARQTIADYSWDDTVEQILALAATT